MSAPDVYAGDIDVEGRCQRSTSRGGSRRDAVAGAGAPHILDGPWYLTWLTTSTVLALLFTYGMWFGIVYRRWSLPGLPACIAAQITVLLGATVLISLTHSWAGTGHFLGTLSAVEPTGLTAALAAVLPAGGYVTIGHATA